MTAIIIPAPPCVSANAFRCKSIVGKCCWNGGCVLLLLIESGVHFSAGNAASVRVPDATQGGLVAIGTAAQRIIPLQQLQRLFALTRVPVPTAAERKRMFEQVRNIFISLLEAMNITGQECHVPLHPHQCSAVV